MSKHLLFVVAAVAVVTACDEAASPGIGRLAGPGDTTRVDTGAAAQLIVSPSFVQVAAASTVQLSTNAPASLVSQVRWASLQPTVATVSQTGLVTALTPGTASITARYSFDTTNVAGATVVVTGVTTGMP